MNIRWNNKKKIPFLYGSFFTGFFYYPEVESAFEVHKFINLATLSYKVIVQDKKERQNLKIIIY